MTVFMYALRAARRAKSQSFGDLLYRNIYSAPRRLRNHPVSAAFSIYEVYIHMYIRISKSDLRNSLVRATLRHDGFTAAD